MQLDPAALGISRTTPVNIRPRNTVISPDASSIGKIEPSLRRLRYVRQVGSSWLDPSQIIDQVAIVFTDVSLRHHHLTLNP